MVDIVVSKEGIRRISHNRKSTLIDLLRHKNHAGLILFSTGTTGLPKAILHDLTLFMKRYETPRPTLKTLNFLVFDHIGGLNTLFHTLFNRGTIVAPDSRNVKDILNTCLVHDIEVLPTTPTFLRMLLLSDMINKDFPPSLKIITYGTERMDQVTLDQLCEALLDIDFRQTYGMSELGILRVKSAGRDSLFMKVGGENTETKILNGTLHIKTKNRMLGYLNDESPFDEEGWYDTKDLVEEKDNYFKILGRANDVINVGGLKFFPSEVERVVLLFDGIQLCKVEGKNNPISGHVELVVQPEDSNYFSLDALKSYLVSKLPNHMMPRKIAIANVKIGH